MQNKSNLQMIGMKKRLYQELLQIPIDTISDSNLDLMYLLSKDSDIQTILEAKRLFRLDLDEQLDEALAN